MSADLGLTRAIRHDRCHAGTCRSVVICPSCGTDTWVQVTHGRWDSTALGGRGATALPFEPVAVTLHCGHEVGDMSAAHPPADPQPTSQDEGSGDE